MALPNKDTNIESNSTKHAVCCVGELIELICDSVERRYFTLVFSAELDQPKIWQKIHDCIIATQFCQ